GAGGVADVAAGGRAEATHLAYRERREVVVQHEVAVVVALDRLDLLLVGLGAQSGGDQRLRLATREHARAVGARQVGPVDRDRPDVGGLAAVDPGVGPDGGGAAPGFFDGFEDFSGPGLFAIVHAQALDHLVEYAAHRLGAALLFVRGERGRELAGGQALNARLQLAVGRRGFDRPAGLPGALHQIALGLRQLLALGVAERN